MVPGVSFYGALADLLANLGSLPTCHTWDMVDCGLRGQRLADDHRVEDHRRTVERHRPVLYINGTYQVAPAGTGRASFAFPPPIGTRTVLVDYPPARSSPFHGMYPPSQCGHS